MCFSLQERQLLGLQGLLPPAILNQDQQVYFVMQNFYRWENDLDRYIYMMSLQVLAVVMGTKISEIKSLTYPNVLTYCYC